MAGPHSDGVAGRTFWNHGRMCASKPWEVIFSLITITTAMISLSDWYKTPQPPRTPQEYQGVDVVVMTALRCTALLYTYHQFCTLHCLGSKYILGIAGLFVVFSSFVFSCSVIKLLDSDVSDLKDALFFFLLVMDLSKARQLAQLALVSSSHPEVQLNIARGMELLGPSMTLDTVVEALVIGAGTLSGVSRLEQMSAFAVLSIVVNYIVFMTFYPACLSLVLELSSRCSTERPPWQMTVLAQAVLEEEKPNPVVQRVKVIMSAGLLLVHGISRWSLAVSSGSVTLNEASRFSALNGSSSELHIFVRWLNAGLDQAVFMVLLIALVVKYIMFESRGPIEEHLISEGFLQPSAGTLRAGLKLHGRVRTISYGSSIKALPQDSLSLLYASLGSSKSTQTDSDFSSITSNDKGHGSSEADGSAKARSIEECVSILASKDGAKKLTDGELVHLVETKHLPSYELEKKVGDSLRGVAIRRAVVSQLTLNPSSMADLPYSNYDYSKVMGTCCENVIGYMPVPVGVAGPLMVNGRKYMVPLATTEGCLVASTNRGCRALINGVKSYVMRDGMTRAPIIQLPSTERAVEVHEWLSNCSNFSIIKGWFDSTSRFARLKDIQLGIAGNNLFLRVIAGTGDAMGMNMVSKGTEAVLSSLKTVFPDVKVMSISGNYCTDKKPSAINWIEGRGKSVVSEAIVPGKVVRSVLKTSVAALVETNILKNLVGSSLAGSVGGNNAHAANIIAAVYIACGQDPAQVVGSSNCMTLMNPCGENGEDLMMSVTLPSLELGTVGGGTGLRPQGACLAMLGVKGAHETQPSENACHLAKIIGGAVLAGELSLMAALVAGQLVSSHLKHNRAKDSPAVSSVHAPSKHGFEGAQTNSEVHSPSNSTPCAQSSETQELNCPKDLEAIETVAGHGDSVVADKKCDSSETTGSGLTIGGNSVSSSQEQNVRSSVSYSNLPVIPIGETNDVLCSSLEKDSKLEGRKDGPNDPSVDKIIQSDLPAPFAQVTSKSQTMIQRHIESAQVAISQLLSSKSSNMYSSSAGDMISTLQSEQEEDFLCQDGSHPIFLHRGSF